MKESRLLWGVYAASAALFLTAQGVALILWRDPGIHLGLLAGYLLGVIPFAGWHLIVAITNGFQEKRRLWVAISVAALKYAVIGVGLWALFRTDAVNLYGLLAGMFLVVPVLLILGSAKAQRP